METLEDHKSQRQALNGDADEHENQIAIPKVEIEEEQQSQQWKNQWKNHTPSKCSEAAEDLAAAGETEGAIALLESVVSNFQESLK